MVSHVLERLGPWRGTYLSILAFLILQLTPALGKRRFTLVEIEAQSAAGVLPGAGASMEKSNLHHRTAIQQPAVASRPNSEDQTDVEVAKSGVETQSSHSKFSASSRASTHLVVTAGAFCLAVILYLRNGLSATSFIKQEGVSADSEAVGIENGDCSTQKLRSLACLVCCWAMCHLSMPSLLLLGNGAKLPLQADRSSSSILQMSLTDNLLLAITAVLGGVVYDRWGHSAAVIYGVAIISPLCIAVEQLSLGFAAGSDDMDVASRIVPLLVPVIMGAMLAWHVSAMMMAFSLFARVYVAPLSFLLAAGVIEGSSHLERLLDDEQSHGGESPWNAGFYGLLALKFASIGLLVCLQRSVFSSDAQRTPRHVLPGKPFVRASLRNLATPKVVFLVFGQVVPIGLTTIKTNLGFTGGRLAAAPWEAMATLCSTSAWGVLLPAYIYIISPEFCQGVITAICIAFLGIISYMDAHLIGYGRSAWSPERLYATIAMFIITTFILVSGREEDIFNAKKLAARS